MGRRRLYYYTETTRLPKGAPRFLGAPLLIGERRKIAQTSGNSFGFGASNSFAFKKNLPKIFEKVKTIIIEQLGVEADSVATEASFIDDLGADSLDIVELIMALEEEFDLEIPDEDAEKIVTVNDVVEYIKSQQ